MQTKQNMVFHKKKADDQQVFASQDLAKIGAIESHNPDIISTAILRNGVAAMETRFAVQQAADKSTGSRQNENCSEMLYEARTLGRVGNLDWNSEPELLLARFIEFMQLLEILPTEYDKPVAPARGGSHVYVCFIAASTLQRAKFVV